MPSCFRCSVACNVFLLFVPLAWDLHQMKHPGAALTATSQTKYIFSQPDQETHSTICVWIMLDLSLGIKNKFLFSLFHFPFSLFPFRQEFTTLQTVPSNKRFTFSNTANKGDHRNDHLMLKTIHCIETNIKGGREDDWPGHKYIICDKAAISPATQLSSSALAHTTSHHRTYHIYTWYRSNMSWIYTLHIQIHIIDRDKTYSIFWMLLRLAYYFSLDLI